MIKWDERWISDEMRSEITERSDINEKMRSDEKEWWRSILYNPKFSPTACKFKL